MDLKFFLRKRKYKNIKEKEEEKGYQATVLFTSSWSQQWEASKAQIAPP